MSRANARVRSNLAGVSASESPAHLELKRLALIWAQADGYPIVACEVSVPNLRFRLDMGREVARALKSEDTANRPFLALRLYFSSGGTTHWFFISATSDKPCTTMEFAMSVSTSAKTKKEFRQDIEEI